VTSAEVAGPQKLCKKGRGARRRPTQTGKGLSRGTKKGYKEQGGRHRVKKKNKLRARTESKISKKRGTIYQGGRVERVCGRGKRRKSGKHGQGNRGYLGGGDADQKGTGKSGGVR